MMVAIVVALSAFLLGMGAIAAFGSDSSGTGAGVGLFAALGAIALSALAVWLYVRRPTWDRSRAQPVRVSRGQRIAIVLLGVAALGWVGHGLVTGQFDPSRGPVIDRARHPGQFWQLVLWYTGVGVILLYIGIRRSASDRSTSKDHDDEHD